MSASPTVTFEELQAAAAAPASSAEPQAQPAATEPPVTPAAPSTPQFTEADAQALRTMADLGITPQNAQQFIQAKQVLDRLPHLLRSNPRAFTSEMAKADPEGYKAFLNGVSDEWYENWEREHPEARQPNGSASTTAASDPRIESKLNDLTSKMENLISRQNQEQTEKQNAAILNGYNSSVDELLAKLPKETPELTKDHIRLKTNELLWKDQAARDRVTKGVYVDIGSHFAKACSLVTADTKAASTKEHERRSTVEANGIRDITPAAEAVNGAPQAAPGEDPTWSVSGMVADLKKALSAK